MGKEDTERLWEFISELRGDVKQILSVQTELLKSQTDHTRQLVHGNEHMHKLDERLGKLEEHAMTRTDCERKHSSKFPVLSAVFAGTCAIAAIASALIAIL